MRTVVVILSGILLFGLCLAGRRWLGGAGPESVAAAVQIFLPVWLGAALLNMYIGVKRAGYSVAEEFPIFLVIFAVPALVALVVLWKAGR
jgi:hypothetical protein